MRQEPSHFPKFLDPKKPEHRERQAKKVEEWRNIPNIYANNRYPGHERCSKSSKEKNFADIARLHNKSFLNDVIPNLIKKKAESGNKEPVNILDIGAGTAIYAEQIREKFGDKVRVFSTGAHKHSVEKNRRKNRWKGVTNDIVNLQSKLHPNDLKWHSILELSDFSEFDLMIDSYGEFNYAPQNDSEFLELLEIVIKKLKPGGMFSMSPILPRYCATEHRDFLLNNIKSKLSEFDVEIEYTKNNMTITKREE